MAKAKTALDFWSVDNLTGKPSATHRKKSRRKLNPSTKKVRKRVARRATERQRKSIRKTLLDLGSGGGPKGLTKWQREKLRREAKAWTKQGQRRRRKK